MKEKLQLNRDDNLYQFFNLFGEHFSNSIGVIINKPIIYEMEEETFTCDSATLAKENMNKTAVYIQESENNIGGLLIFDTETITAMADLMMMGSGEGSKTLNDELKDAIKELTSQGVSSINVPFQERFDKKVSFNVVDVSIIETKLDIDEKELIVQPFKIHLDNNEAEFYLAVSNNIKKIIGTYTKNVTSGDFEYDDALDFNMSDHQERGSSKFDSNSNIEMLLDVDIPVSVRIGSTRMFLKDIVAIGPGNIIELDNYADEPVELLINNKPIARGEVVIVDGFFGIRIKEIISKEERLKKLRDK